MNEYESLIKKDERATQSIKNKDKINFIDEDSEEEEKPISIKKTIREITSESESESDSDDEPKKQIKLPNKYKI